MFVLSKIYTSLVNPGFWVLLLVAGGTALLWTRWYRGGRRILAATALFLAFVAVVPVGNWATAVLENRFPTVRDLPARIDGIVVLGGTINQFVTRARGQPALTDGAERLTEFVALARRHPEARLMFTGGSGSVTRQDVKEAEAARMFFAQMGLDVGRVMFEDRSRNTWENALFTYRMAAPKPGETWVLITSAQHMPRSVGTFRKAGWQPLPYPVDYLTYDKQHVFAIDFLGGLYSLWWAMREWMGLAAYYLLDRSDALFPAPAPAPPT